MQMQTLLIFVPACFALNMAFGPSNLLSLTIGARHGVGTALAAAAGRLAAFVGMIALAALGLGVLLAASELFFTLVKWAGAAYLVWLGLRLIRSGPGRAEPGPQGIAGRALLRQEFLVAIGNPKAILIFTAFFPQFVDPAAYWQSFAVLGALFLLLEAVAIAAYALIGARLGRFAASPAAMARINRLSGAVMVAFGVLLVFARRPA